MDVIFIRHGSAEPAGAGGDEARQLTNQGREEVATTAAALKGLIKKLDLVLTSPLVRAVQTAEIVAEAFGAAVEQDELLAPPARPKPLRRRLDELSRRPLAAVALVGHAPSLDEYVGDLVAGTTAIGLSLPKSGSACVSLPEPGADEGPELRWLLRRKHLALLARKV